MKKQTTEGNGKQTTSKRTPGTWKAVGREVYSDDGTMIARACDGDFADETNYDKLVTDAQFLAAAPDLYRAVMALLDIEKPRPTPAANRIAMQHAHRVALEALTKADGVTSAALAEALILWADVNEVPMTAPACDHHCPDCGDATAVKHGGTWHCAACGRVVETSNLK